MMGLAEPILYAARLYQRIINNIQNQHSSAADAALLVQDLISGVERVLSQGVLIFLHWLKYLHILQILFIIFHFFLW